MAVWKWCLVYIVCITLLAVLAPWVTLYSYDTQNISEVLQGPSLYHWMGTDALGRDLYSRIIYGSRMSLAVGISTTFFALIFGTVIGAFAGYRGGWVDQILNWIIDLFCIFPPTLLAVLFTLCFGRGFLGIVIALGVTAWMTHARLVRGQILQAREFLYVEAARSLGLSHLGIVLRHMLPNLFTPMMVSLTSQIQTHVMTESFLSFMGLGLQPPYASWGTLIQEGYQGMQSYPHLIIFPSLLFFFTMLAFNLLGDGLSTALTITHLEPRKLKNGIFLFFYGYDK